jgi:hypothetical protein
LRLLRNVVPVQPVTVEQNPGVHIMKKFHFIARLAQALFAIGMTLITGLVIFA